VPPDAAQALMALVERDAAAIVSVDLEGLTVRGGGVEAACTMPAAARRAFLAGTWDATALLTADFDAVRAAAARLPYVGGFRSARA
jgi:3-isopropylmalate/(R)-2-methylmalate dehydratase small subunit